MRPWRGKAPKEPGTKMRPDRLTTVSGYGGKKRKLYLVQWSEGSERLSHKLGWCDEMTLSQAKRAKRQFMDKINSHREVAGDSVTLERFFREHYWNEETKEYGDELRTKRPST